MKIIFPKNAVVIALAAMAAVFGFYGNAFAAQAGCPGTPGKLLIYVQNDPCPLTGLHKTALFDETNFDPGQTITGWLLVTNNSDSAQEIAIEAVNFADPAPDDDLSRVLEIVIDDGTNDLYGGVSSTGPKTLNDFFRAGEVGLSKLASGASARYNIKLSFPADKSDEWQGKTTGFDLLAGFLGTDFNGLVVPGGGSVSVGGQARGLTIQEPVAAVDVRPTTATITWTTNYPATSQVIYAAASESHTLDLNAANYGYLYSSIEDPAQVLDHTVTLTGLLPGATYYYRAVSRQSLAVSRSYSFSTSDVPLPEVKGASTENSSTKNSSESGATNLAINQNRAGTQPTIPQVKNAETGQPKGSNTKTAANDQQYKNPGVLGASIANDQTCRTDFPWLAFIIFIVFCLWRALVGSRWRNHWFAGSILSLALAVWAFTARRSCQLWIPFLLAAAAAIIAWIFEKTFKKSSATRRHKGKKISGTKKT